MKKNNKGFTLVELIIVVAIIAVLAAVLAPQYLRYVERARQSNDLQVATNYMRAATVAVTDLSQGFHLSSNTWFVFKWGYDTSNNNTMNIHMGVATVDASGRPTGIDNGKKEPVLQTEVAKTMGWTDATDTIQVDLIDRPQSEAARYVYAAQNSFVFYVNVRTGEILVDKGSANWVDIIGVNAPLTT